MAYNVHIDRAQIAESNLNARLDEIPLTRDQRYEIDGEIRTFVRIIEELTKDS